MEDERQEELESLLAIFPELIIYPEEPSTACLELSINPATPLLVRFIPVRQPPSTAYAKVATAQAAHIENDVELSYLPPITLRMVLPDAYPAEAPPTIHLSTQLDWLPVSKLQELEKDVNQLWEEYGRSQVLYVYIDHLHQAAERGFDLRESTEGCCVLSTDLQSALIDFDAKTKQASFDAGTYDCGVCLERRKGSACYQMERCRHIFCRECLQAFYNNAIKEGDIAGIRCLDPGCGSDKPLAEDHGKKRKSSRTLHPRELLAMGLEESVVRRFLEMKRKKRLEADKSTVYCPRTWCQGPAKSAKYPPIPADLSTYISSDHAADIESEDDANSSIAKTGKNANGKHLPPDPSDRLAVCEKCSLAFCRVCYMGWHGPFARCYPRDPNELSAEEKASYEYIRMHTSPCAYCNAPVQKTMGCNHMCCFQCNTHFCYLCGAWLDPASPYKHFNTQGTPCFQRLWELEEGDDGQAPEDGRGFGGGRAWEQLAIEAARRADAVEAEAAAAAAAAVQEQTEEDREDAEARVARAILFPAPDPPQAAGLPIRVAMAQVRLDRPGEQQQQQQQQPPPAPQRARRRPRNPFPAGPPAPGAAQAVRNHELAGGRRRRQVEVPAARREDEWDERRQAELQRFLEMAQRDEEDGWDSDDLGDDDERFVIR